MSYVFLSVHSYHTIQPRSLCRHANDDDTDVWPSPTQTETDDVPLALLAFQGRLLAGIGASLRIYDIGLKKLLRKSESPSTSFSSPIVSLNTQGSRILVGDMQDSISYAVYKAPENRLLVFADDSQPRWVTCAAMVDYGQATQGLVEGGRIIWHHACQRHCCRGCTG